MKNFLHILVLISFVLAGISPACKFISGEMKQVEICSYDGMKTITVADQKAPDDKHEHKKSDDCGFCFAQSHLKLTKAIPPVFILIRTAYVDVVLFEQDIQISRPELQSLSPRAPPVIL